MTISKTRNEQNNKHETDEHGEQTTQTTRQEIKPGANKTNTRQQTKRGIDSTYKHNTMKNKEETHHQCDNK